MYYQICRNKILLMKLESAINNPSHTSKTAPSGTVSGEKIIQGTCEAALQQLTQLAPFTVICTQQQII